MLTPKLMLMISTLSSTAWLMALIIKFDGTDSPSDETLYEKISAIGAIPFSCPSAAIIPVTCVPCPFVSCGTVSLSTKSYPFKNLDVSS